MGKAYCLLILLVLFSYKAVGQRLIADTLALPEHEVRGSGLVKNIAFDTLSSKSISNLDWATMALSEISYKTYGVSGVGGISFRGLPSNQVVIEWNGLQLNSPLQGQYDLGQLPITGAWSATLNKEPVSNASQTGSASVNFSLKPLLPDSVKKGKAISLQESIGSFGKLQSELRSDIIVGGWTLQSRLMHQQAKNDFKIYRPTNSDPLLPQTQQNANAYYKQGEFRVLTPEWHLWRSSISILYNESYRNQPTPSTKYFSNDNLSGKMLGGVFSSYAQLGRSTSYKLQLGGLFDKSKYRYEDGKSFDNFNFNSFQLQGNLEHNLPFSIKSYFSHSHKATEGNFNGINKTQFTHCLQLDFTATYKKCIYEAGVSSYLYMFKVNPLINASLSKSILYRNLEFNIKISTHGIFRVPSLNDLYYPKLGNPGIQPESGQSYNGLFESVFKSYNKRVFYRMSINPFIYTYSKFIQWQPVGGLWKPNQLLNFYTTGYSVIATIKTNFAFDLTISNNLTLINSGFGKPRFQFNHSGTQLLYTAAVKNTATLTLSRKRLGMKYQLLYMGESQTQSDKNIQSMLPSFFIHTITLDYAIIDKLKFGTQVNFSSPNTYQWIENYPAPKIWILASLAYELNNF